MKRISPATVTFGLMAVVLGLVAAYIVKQALNKPVVVQPPPVVVPAPVDPGVRVVFAKANITKNSRILAGDLYTTFVPRTAKAATGTVPDVSQIEGRISKVTIKAGQAIRDEYLLGIGEGLPNLAERLPPGMRAVTVSVQDPEAGGKRLAEGDHVDISLTVEGTHPDLGEVTTRTLMRNVLVVDAIASRPTIRGVRRSQDQMESNLTFAVSPADANKLIVAQRTGTLKVNLVAAADLQQPPLDANDSITRRQLLGLADIPPPVQVVPPRKYTVEKWSGGSMRVLEMSGDRVRDVRDVNTNTKAVEPPPAAADPFKTSSTHSGVKEPVRGAVQYEADYAAVPAE
ncbi:hypothetical protein ETAA8_61850 [Anatilimnocola aggregata]|uniref:SAF domain-containing protein n=1 Tax=Anatilimnocola aggregata TaxID=2528021 RepID=A0A517YLC8_9BACT|nr:Flp pilus assembly protein CpaB [Anatilimnocola aggregata]QDU31032.1 hypothetical protein ETAA8_61850 [Anatilimnocola aggregata]